MAISAGELREKIKFQRPIRTSNGSGGFTTVYDDLLSTFASVKEERSNAQLTANQEDIVNYVYFKIRYRPDFSVKNADRLVWRDFNFIVNNIKVDTLRTQIEIYANSEIETSER